MLIPLIVALGFQDKGLLPFCVSCTISFSLGAFLYYKFRDAEKEVPKRTAFLMVSLSWLSATIIGALPFYISGSFVSFIDAWFESASGFTTTGASVLSNIEALPRSILLWRSLTQFMGGMGMIVLSLAILPLLGVGGMDLYRAEAPGPTSDKISSRVSQTARALWIVYVVFVLLQFICLFLLGMTPFDAINHAMTTMATGGFSTKNTSMAHYNSPAIDLVISFFMFCAGISFILHYRFFVRRELKVFKNRELRFYSLLTLFSILVLSFFLWGRSYDSFPETLRYVIFQVTSIMSSTGFGTADFALWAPFAQVFLLSLMVVGGSAGSTAGGIKCVRALLLIKQGVRELYLMIHPNAVRPLRIGTQVVSDQVTSAIFAFFYLYILLVGITTFALTLFGLDIITSVSAVISALSNIGPGLGEVGPSLNYGSLPNVVKMLLGFCMIVGRLEIFTVLVLFTPEFWRK